MHDYPPGTWWWGLRDGHRTLFPLMTLEHLDDLPVSDANRFRCVRCKVEGTGHEVMSTLCTDPTWYHGDVREYRRYRAPMRCLDGKGLFGWNACGYEWVRERFHVVDGHCRNTDTKCPACGSSKTEEIA